MNEMVRILDKFETVSMNTPYQFNGINVPRVTSIIEKCINNDYIARWANSLGFKHKSYNKVIKEACDIGTHTHECIDEYLTDDGFFVREGDIPIESYYAYQSFLTWFSTINGNANVKVLFHEKQIICKYFGGTLDGLYEVNGKIYLVDYKTSNHIGFKYTLQLAAYRYMLREVLGIEIDGCIILQLSKTSIAYNEYVLNFDKPEELQFINDCENAFLSLVYAYYNIMKIENDFKNLGWEW